MATLLDNSVLADALTGLEGWRGDTGGITREVTLPADEVDGFLTSLHESARTMDHQPAIDNDGSGLSITLRTDSEGGVTELDIAMASHIDDLVLAANNVHRTMAGSIVVDGFECDEPGATVVGVPALPEEASVAVGSGEAASGEEPWHGADNQPSEPLAGVGSTAGGGNQVPLPDTAPGEPQPGLNRLGGPGGLPTGDQSTQGAPLSADPELD